MKRALLAGCLCLAPLAAWGAYNEPTIDAVLQSALGANVFNALGQALDAAGGLVGIDNLSADINSALPFNGASGLLQLTAGAFEPAIDKVGTTSSAAAAAGNVGEVIASDVPQSSAVSMTTVAQKTITSVSLTPGDWSCSGSIAGNPAGSTTTSVIAGGISTVANTLPASEFTTSLTVAFAAGASFFGPVPSVIERVSSTTTVNLVGLAVFTTSTLGMYGQISCRRMR